MIKNLRIWWIHFTTFLSKTISGIHMPYSRKLIKGSDYYNIREVIEPGMVICTVTRGELSSIGIPDFWGHVAIVYDNESVIEATTHGVVKTDLVSFMMNKDYVAVMRPMFLSKKQMFESAIQASSQIGKEYDFEFELTDVKKFYCSELVAWSYERVCNQTPFTPREVLGRITIIPSDFYNAKDKFALIWASEEFIKRKLA